MMLLQEATASKRGYLDLNGFIDFFRSLPEFQGKVSDEWLW